MRKVTKTVSTHFAEKLADSRIYCNVGSEHNPSGEDWIKCYLHLITAWVDKQKELPKMSPNGIHLSNIYAGTFIDMLIERFEAFDGSPFSHRSLMDNIALGRNRN